MLLTGVTLLSIISISNAATLPRQNSLKIVVGNDDGWATANIRALYNALNQTGYESLISAPTENLSGTSSLEFPPIIPLISAGEFDTIPAGSPGTGCNTTDPSICYVNSFPASAIEYGIKTFAPEVLGGAPDFAVTGVNVGTNLGLDTLVSGTVGAASEAVSLGVPAIAFSGAGSSQHSYTEADPVSDLYAQVSLKLVNAVIASGTPYLPSGIALNVNFPMSNSTTCSQASDFTFILTRIYANPFTTDVNQCDSDHLPTETDVFNSGDCRVPISVFNTATKLDASSDNQQAVRNKISSLLTCMPSS